MKWFIFCIYYGFFSENDILERNGRVQNPILYTLVCVIGHVSDVE